MAEVRIAKSAFLTELDGQMIGIRKGMIVDADHPIIRGREELFARPEDCIELAVEKAPKQSKRSKKNEDAPSE